MKIFIIWIKFRHFGQINLKSLNIEGERVGNKVARIGIRQKHKYKWENVRVILDFYKENRGGKLLIWKDILKQLYIEVWNGLSWGGIGSSKIILLSR